VAYGDPGTAIVAWIVLGLIAGFVDNRLTKTGEGVRSAVVSNPLENLELGIRIALGAQEPTAD